MPAPYAFSEPYSLFEAGELQTEIINGKNYYKSEIKNVGNNYLDISGCSLEQENAINEAISAYSEVIAPGKSKTVYFESNYEDKAFAKENIKAKAYGEAVRDLVNFKDKLCSKCKLFTNVERKNIERSPNHPFSIILKDGCLIKGKTNEKCEPQPIHDICGGNECGKESQPRQAPQ